MIETKRKNQGFITVEAAIFLPVFFIGLLTLAYLIKILWIQESAFFVFEKEAHQLAKRTYAVETFEKGDEILGSSFELLLKSKVYQEQPKDVQQVELHDYHYFYNHKGMTGMISGTLHYNIKIKMPIPFYDEIPIDDTLFFRAFIGADDNFNPMKFQEMEMAKQSHLVWIFPREGRRYHMESCTYISNEPKQVLVTNQLRKQYDSCQLCQSSEIANGNVSYCFTRAGKVFHKGTCPTVDKYVISIEKEEAAEKGYTPCVKCGGG